MRYLMFRKAIKKVKRILSIVYFGLLILRWCGPRLFVRKMAHQLYGRTIFLVTVQTPDHHKHQVDFDCTVNLATSEDVKELFNSLHTESPKGRYELLVRKWYHEQGFGDCYITRTANTNEICAVRWLVNSEHIRKLGWEDRFPLDKDEYMSENLYTFERYRHQGVRLASASRFRNIVLQLGYSHNKGYTDVTNEDQRRHQEQEGSPISAVIIERHFLFHVIRKIVERYDPPIPRTALPNIK